MKRGGGETYVLNMISVIQQEFILQKYKVYLYDIVFFLNICLQNHLYIYLEVLCCVVNSAVNVILSLQTRTTQTLAAQDGRARSTHFWRMWRTCVLWSTDSCSFSRISTAESYRLLVRRNERTYHEFFHFAGSNEIFTDCKTYTVELF